MQSLTCPDTDSHSLRDKNGPSQCMTCSFSSPKVKALKALTIVLLHSKGATDVKVTADMVKAALEEAEKAQNAAEKAIKQADKDIKGTQDLLTSVSSS